MISPGRALAAMAATLGALAPAAPASAAAAAGVPACALGRLPAALQTVLPEALAEERRRFSASLRGLSRAERARASTAFATGAAAYLYGMPTVVLRLTVERFPVNQLLGIGRLARPQSRTVVAPNHDTLYSVTKLDLGAGVLMIDAPATGGRYSVLQLLDAYTNVVAYVGSGSERDRATTVALVPPGWRGALPAGVRVVRSPTKLVWLLGRTLAGDDASDMAEASGLIARYALTPLESWAAGRRNTATILPGFPGRQPPIRVPTGLAFYDALGRALAADPPPARDGCALRAFARAGIAPGQSPTESADPLRARALSRAARAGERLVDLAVTATRRDSQRRHNGWSVTLGDTGRFGTDYAHRAVIAASGLASNVPSEAVYPATDTDRRGRALTGRHAYVVRFRAGGLPPVRAFWSLTLYNRNLFLHANPLGRYAVGDRTDGLRYGPGRSLEIYVQRHPPRGARRANWLPAPRGRFALYLRLYEPKRQAAAGRWTPPTVARVR